jgi:thioredoxin reductase (NADPH)
LSAAINLKTYNKNFLWFGNAQLSEKVQKAEMVVNYPGMPEITGQELATAFVNHKEHQGLEITDKIVSSIYDMGGYYNVMAENQFFETDSIILAVGVIAANQYAGEETFVGRGVSYCATCDGALYKGKNIAVVSTSKRFEHEVKFLADLAEKVYLFPYYRDCEIEKENVEFVKKPIKEIKGGFRANELVLGDEESMSVDGIFIMRNAISPTTLLNKLEVVDGHINVNRQM